MRVRVISLKQCDATPVTITLVLEMAAEMAVDIDFEHVEISTLEEARMYRHIGSPTVQVEGVDIEPEARVIQRFGLS